MLVDTEREHGEVQAPQLRRRVPAEELVRSDEHALPLAAELERVDVVLRQAEGAHVDAADINRVTVAQDVQAYPALGLHERQVVQVSEMRAHVLGDLLREVHVRRLRLLRLGWPTPEVDVPRLPDPPAHRVVRMPVRVEARPDLVDSRAVELEPRLLGGVEEHVRPVDERARTGARVAPATLPGLDADLAAAAGPRSGRRPGGTEDLDVHASSAAGSVSRRSLATSPARCGTSSAARQCATAAAAAASCASSPFARNAATIPVRTSPVPAVASAGGPKSLTTTPEPGAATMVSGPLSRTTAPKRSAPVRAASSRCAPTQAESFPRSLPSSPAWGVRTVAAPRSTGSSSNRASASTTAGRSMRSRRSRTSARRPSPRPSPGPRASAPTRSAASEIVSTAVSS